MNWAQQFAQRTELMRRSTVREFLKYARRPGMISFGGGLPAPELFPLAQFESACETALKRHGSSALQYGETEGVNELREYVANKLGVASENVLITSGAQQALDLLGRVLINEGDRVAVENPTYLALLSSWRVHKPQFEPVDSDENGLVVNALKSHCKVTYLVPNFQNPQGTTLSLDRRIELAECAARRQMVVVEDDPYGELRYEGARLPLVFEIAGKCNGPVISVGTFSKVLSPGLRVGWVAGHRDVIERLVQAKQSADLHTSTLNQCVALELVKNGLLECHVPILQAEYKKRRDTMLEALQRLMPPKVQWSYPAGGMFLLMRLGEEVLGRNVAEAALQHEVVVVPGDDFHVHGGRDTLRLNFSNCSPARIAIGVERLAKVIKILTDSKADHPNSIVSFSPA